MDIYLKPMTKDLMHAFYKGFTYDADTFPDSTPLQSYIYEEGSVDAIYAKHQKQGKPHYAIMLESVIIGDIYFKHFDQTKKTCELSIHLMSDSVKNKGYGTQAEILALEHAFDVLKVETVFADALIKNARSCRVLEKAGFIATHDDGQYRYFRCDHAKWRQNYGNSKEKHITNAV